MAKDDSYRVAVAAVLVAMLLALVGMRPAEAVFPGLNGKIVFQSTRTIGPGVHNPTGDFEIFFMNPDGTGLTQITDNTTDDVDPAWSPDGQKIAFASSRSGSFDVYVMDLCDACRGTQRLVNAPGPDVDPTWSPDGQRIAFATRRDDNWEIYARDSDDSGSSNLINLTRDGAQDQQPAWSPDGQRLAFSRFTACRVFCPARAHIYTMKATDGTEQVNATDTEAVAFDAFPAWSPDGGKIAFNRKAENSSDARSDIFTVEAGVVNRLVTSNSSSGRPAFSPDGRQIAYCQKDGLDIEIYTRGLSGTSSPVNLTNNDGWDCAPDWQRPVNSLLDFEATGMGLFEGIDYGQTSSLSGRLSAGGQPIAGKTVILEQRPFSIPPPISSGWTSVPGGTVTTAGDGTFRLDGFQPERSVYLRARFAGDPALNLRSVTGPRRALPVKAVVSLDDIKLDPRAGRPYTYGGSIAPADPGRSVKLAIRSRGGTTPLREQFVPVTAGRYSASFTLNDPGNYTIEALFPGTADYVGDADTKSFRVVR